MRKRALSLLCAMAVLLALAQPVLAASSRFGDPAHGQKDFSQMQYQRPDMAAFTAKCRQAEALAADPDRAKEAAALVEALVKDMEKNLGMLQLASIYQSQDVTNRTYAEEYSACNRIYQRARNALSGVMDAVRASATADAALEALVSPEVYDGLMGLGAVPEEVQALSEQETDLYNTYLERSNQPYETRVNGVAMTREELNAAYLAGKLSRENYERAWADLARKRNEALGGIYLQLLSLYRREAAFYGYEDPVEYLYGSYGRDYAPADIEPLAEHAAEILAPVAAKLGAISDSTALDELGASLTGAEIMDLAAPYLADLGPEFQESYQYMRKYHLADLDASDTKAYSGFTAELPAEDSVFMFNQPYGNFFDVTTFIHEFGHYNQTYWTMSEYMWLEPFQTDVLEIHSQTLELLFHAYYDEMFGELAQEARSYNLTDLLGAVSSGCMVDEFERYALRTEGVTLRQLNDKYTELREKYGAEADGMDWVEISHLYGSPGYYIAYATSAAAALQIWSQSLTDRDAALETYYRAIERSGETYSALLEDCGLRQPGDPAMLRSIRAAAEKEAGIPVDTYGHWAEEAIELMDYRGLMEGVLCADGYTRFLPEQTVTRAQLVVVLQRLYESFFGEAEAGPAASFTDMAADAWYADAASWAAEAGVAGGYADGSFRGNRAVSRQELAAMLYRFVDRFSFLKAADAAALADFRDAGQVPEGFREALAWAVGSGLLGGDEGRLLPQGAATRAQCAVVLERLLQG